MTITCLTNIFNEEYLLPFWLIHHKNMFDKFIIIDYNSTDRSVEICKKIIPNCEILTTRNKYFEASEIDKEFMELEEKIEGFKIVLNTTEFIFSNKHIRELLDENSRKSYSIKCMSPYSNKIIYPKNIVELKYELLDENTLYHFDRLYRFIHNYKNGNYTIGRHSTNNNSVHTDQIHILWLGFFPNNEKTLERKLQIQNNIPKGDIMKGFGIHHITNREKLLNINKEKYNTGKSLIELNRNLYSIIYDSLKNKSFIVTGGCGFIGSHLTDLLVSLGHRVIVVDNISTGNLENLNKNSILEKADITDFNSLNSVFEKHKIDGVFHLAAIARTPWCIEDPILCYKTNVIGTLNVLECCRKNKVKKIVLSSSNVVYAAMTPYRTSKEALESLSETYSEMYGLDTICLRYSNVYGPRQSEEGPSPNVFAALRKSKKVKGKLTITGDGNQSRNYTHVKDIALGNLLAMFSQEKGVIDLCTGIPVTLNYVSKFFNCEIEYIDERFGDVKHIIQNPDNAFSKLGWKHNIEIEEGIKDVL